MRRAVLSFGLILLLAFDARCAAFASPEIGGLMKVDCSDTGHNDLAISILHFIDAPFGMSPEDLMAHMRREYGIALSSTLTEEDRQDMEDNPTIEMYGRMTAPFGSATFLGFPIGMRFRVSQNELSGVHMDFADENANQGALFEEPLDARRARRQEAADIYFSIANHLQEMADPPQDAVMIGFAPPTEPQKGYTLYNYPMKDGRPDEAALRMIIDAEENLVFLSAYDNIQIRYEVSYGEGSTSEYSYLSCYYVVSMFIGMDEIAQVFKRSEKRADYD